MTNSDRLSINPNARFQETMVNGRLAYKVSLPVRRVGLSHRIIDESEPELMNAVATLIRSVLDKSLVLPRAYIAQLIDLGVVLPQSQIPDKPLFRPLLIPHHVSDKKLSACGLELVGDLEFDEPIGAAQFGTRQFLGDLGGAIWHRQSANAPFVPWWPNEEVFAALKSLKSSRLRRDSKLIVGREIADCLVAARIARFDTCPSRRVEHTGSFARFVVIPQAMTTALSTYYQTAYVEGLCEFGDGQAKRHVLYNDPCGRLVQAYAAEEVCAVMGQQYIPTYTYFSGYREQTDLLPHRDREQCELTVTLLLRYSPMASDRSPWPLVLGDGCESVEVFQRVGECIAFFGTAVTHSRPALPAGHECDVLLMHYVGQNFKGPFS